NAYPWLCRGLNSGHLTCGLNVLLLSHQRTLEAPELSHVNRQTCQAARTMTHFLSWLCRYTDWPFSALTCNRTANRDHENVPGRGDHTLHYRSNILLTVCWCADLDTTLCRSVTDLHTC
ncbi:hypothetical protein T265_13061, partial [Opisthorchis viverrini]